MRKLILERINEIRHNTQGFKRSLQRWGDPITHGTITKYADEIDFEALPDAELAFLFERILKRYYQQM